MLLFKLQFHATLFTCLFCFRALWKMFDTRCVNSFVRTWKQTSIRWFFWILFLNPTVVYAIVYFWITAAQPQLEFTSITTLSFKSWIGLFWVKEKLSTAIIFNSATFQWLTLILTFSFRLTNSNNFGVTNSPWFIVTTSIVIS